MHFVWSMTSAVRASCSAHKNRHCFSPRRGDATKCKCVCEWHARFRQALLICIGLVRESDASERLIVSVLPNQHMECVIDRLLEFSNLRRMLGRRSRLAEQRGHRYMISLFLHAFYLAGRLMRPEYTHLAFVCNFFVLTYFAFIHGNRIPKMPFAMDHIREPVWLAAIVYRNSDTEKLIIKIRSNGVHYPEAIWVSGTSFPWIMYHNKFIC